MLDEKRADLRGAWSETTYRLQRLRDNADCLPCGLNLSEATARTAAMIGVFNGIAATVPPNAGSFRQLIHCTSLAIVPAEVSHLAGLTSA